MIAKIRYYINAIRWLYHNRTWANTRQKFKAIDKALKEGADKRGRWLLDLPVSC